MHIIYIYIYIYIYITVGLLSLIRMSQFNGVMCVHVYIDVCVKFDLI